MFKTTATNTLKQDKKCQPCWYIILSTMFGSTTIKVSSARLLYLHSDSTVQGTSPDELSDPHTLVPNFPDLSGY